MQRMAAVNAAATRGEGQGVGTALVALLALPVEVLADDGPEHSRSGRTRMRLEAAARGDPPGAVRATGGYPSRTTPSAEAAATPAPEPSVQP